MRTKEAREIVSTYEYAATNDLRRLFTDRWQRKSSCRRYECFRISLRFSQPTGRLHPVSDSLPGLVPCFCIRLNTWRDPFSFFLIRLNILHGLAGRIAINHLECLLFDLDIPLRNVKAWPLAYKKCAICQNWRTIRDVKSPGPSCVPVRVRKT